jgi:hypothetical protein
MSPQSAQSPYTVQVMVGPSYDELRPVHVNNEAEPFEFSGPNFIGYAVVRLKNYAGDHAGGGGDGEGKFEHLRNPASTYFNGKTRTYSFSIQGASASPCLGAGLIVGAAAAGGDRVGLARG